MNRAWSAPLSGALLIAASVAWASPDEPFLADSLPVDLAKQVPGARLLPRYMVALRDGVDSRLFGLANGVRADQTLRSTDRILLIPAESVAAARRATQFLGSHPSVLWTAQDAFLPRKRRSFYPNDRYFPVNRPSAPWPGQWYLENQVPTTPTLHPQIDIDVVGPWAENLLGHGVVVGVVDDSLETNHSDLRLNYSAVNSYDFGSGDPDPNPVYLQDAHGTAVAGIIAGYGGNSVGITGVAPRALLAGLRVDFLTGTVSQFVDATVFRSSPPTYPIKIKNHSYGVSIPFFATTAEVNALNTSSGVGTIHVWAAGNDRGGSTEDSNRLMLQSSANAITVAALGFDGKFASYSSYGANVFVTAPSDSDVTSWNGVAVGFLTTDRSTENFGYNGPFDTFPHSDYTASFGGTSAAAPIVSGALAIVRKVRPTLTTRFAKHLLVRSSEVVDPLDATDAGDTWRTNAAGNRFNQNYGFGLIDVEALVRNARAFTGVTALQTESTALVGVSAAIPDNNVAGITRTFRLTRTTPLEEVRVRLRLTHTYRGDLEAYLTSPSGTRMRIFNDLDDSNNDIDWSFTVNGFWGENPAGEWTLQVRDIYPSETGRWVSYQVFTRNGRLISAGP
jgi:subtilisin family serine protease